MNINQIRDVQNTEPASAHVAVSDEKPNGALETDKIETGKEQKSYLDSLSLQSKEESNPLQHSIKDLHNVETSKPEDSSSDLTKRLVAASGQFEVRQVLSDAHKNMLSLRVAALQGNGDNAKLARAYIKKLDKLIRRAQRKIEDIGEENMKKIKSARAEQQKQQKRAEEIKRELELEMKKRRRRENGYLLEEEQNLFAKNEGSAWKMSSADIARMAETLAAAEIASKTALSGEGGAADADFGSTVSESPATAGTPAGDAGSTDIVV